MRKPTCAARDTASQTRAPSSPPCPAPVRDCLSSPSPLLSAASRKQTYAARDPRTTYSPWLAAAVPVRVVRTAPGGLRVIKQCAPHRTPRTAYCKLQTAPCSVEAGWCTAETARKKGHTQNTNGKRQHEGKLTKPRVLRGRLGLGGQANQTGYCVCLCDGASYIVANAPYEPQASIFHSQKQQPPIPAGFNQFHAGDSEASASASAQRTSDRQRALAIKREQTHRTQTHVSARHSPSSPEEAAKLRSYDFAEPGA